MQMDSSVFACSSVQYRHQVLTCASKSLVSRMTKSFFSGSNSRYVLFLSGVPHILQHGITQKYTVMSSNRGLGGTLQPSLKTDQRLLQALHAS